MTLYFLDPLFSQSLSYALDGVGRGDILVTGSSNSVYPRSSTTAGVDHRGTFNTYSGGVLKSSTKTLDY